MEQIIHKRPSCLQYTVQSPQDSSTSLLLHQGSQSLQMRHQGERLLKRFYMNTTHLCLALLDYISSRTYQLDTPIDWQINNSLLHLNESLPTST